MDWGQQNGQHAMAHSSFSCLLLHCAAPRQAAPRAACAAQRSACPAPHMRKTGASQQAQHTQCSMPSTAQHTHLVGLGNDFIVLAGVCSTQVGGNGLPDLHSTNGKAARSQQGVPGGTGAAGSSEGPRQGQAQGCCCWCSCCGKGASNSRCAKASSPPALSHLRVLQVGVGQLAPHNGLIHL